jgi:hypothetical protein
MSIQNDQLKETDVKKRQQLWQHSPFFIGGYQPIYDLPEGDELPPIPRGGTGESGRGTPNKTKRRKKIS